MIIDDALITYLEELSRLSFTDEEKEAVKRDLGKILGYINSLSELETAGGEELSHPFPYFNVFREDTVSPSYEREIILSNAPMQKDGYFQVPKTVE